MHDVTSKAGFFDAAELPQTPKERNALPRGVDSPDPCGRYANDMGGATVKQNEGKEQMEQMEKAIPARSARLIMSGGGASALRRCRSGNQISGGRRTAASWRPINIVQTT
jgi:2-methylaconitate cis-trans-isomerase PrpF